MAGVSKQGNVLRNGHIASYLRSQMKQRGWTGMQLTRELGLKAASNSLVSYWLSGRTAPSPVYRKRLAKLFKEPIETFSPKAAIGEAVQPLALPAPERKQRREEALTISVGTDGVSRIRLDLSVPTSVAMKIFNALSDQLENLKEEP